MKARLSRLVCAFILMVTALIASPVGQAHAFCVPTTYHVTNLTDAAPGSLRDQVGNANSGCDIVDFSVTGTIKLLSPLYVGFDLNIVGPGSASLILSGGGKSMVLVIQPGVTVSISDITITGGYLNQTNGVNGGGGISNNGTLTLTNVVVSKNKVYATNNAGVVGGGIFNHNGATLTVNSSLITQNLATGKYVVDNPGTGGGIQNQGTLTINNSTITKNKANRAGGGIYSVDGTTNILNGVIISGNMVTGTYTAGGDGAAGGAIFVGSSSTLTADGAAIDHNSALDAGGGIYVANSATVNITRSSITNNKISMSGGAGGGLFINQNTTANLTNVTISNNIAQHGNGGGVKIANGTTLGLSNVTVSNNYGGTGGGGLQLSSATANIQNTLIANNTIGAFSGPDCASSGGTLTSNDYNLIGNSSACTPSNGVQAHDIMDEDPHLGTLAHNGGSITFSRPLLNGSPAIDAGDPTPATCPATDQRGVLRPQAGRNIGTAYCDIGAYEDRAGATVPLTFYSTPSKDGWVLESLDVSNAPTGLGGTMDDSGGAIRIGDGIGTNQYVGILSFLTAGLPDNAVVWDATLQLTQDPATGSGNTSGLSFLIGDVKAPYFGSSSGLNVSDFEAAPDLSGDLAFGYAGSNIWHATTPGGEFLPAAMQDISLTKTTQFKVRFLTKTNGDGVADFLSFFSGENSTLANKPTLTLQYYIP